MVKLAGNAPFLEEAHFDIPVYYLWTKRINVADSYSKVVSVLRLPGLSQLRTFSLALRMHDKAYDIPAFFRTASIESFIYRFDTSPLNDSDRSLISIPSTKPADTCIKRWIDILIEQTTVILRSRIESQFIPLDERISWEFQIHMQMKWLDSHGAEIPY